jgi:hypothetical protein
MLIAVMSKASVHSIHACHRPGVWGSGADSGRPARVMEMVGMSLYGSAVCIHAERNGMPMLGKDIAASTAGGVHTMFTEHVLQYLTDVLVR